MIDASKIQGQIWIFYNSKSKKKHDPLNLMDAQIFILGLKEKQISEFFVWTPGWSNWSKLSDYLKSDSQVFMRPPTKIKSDTKSNIDRTIYINETKTSMQLPMDVNTQSKIFSMAPEVKGHSSDSNSQEKSRSTKKESKKIQYPSGDFHGDQLEYEPRNQNGKKVNSNQDSNLEIIRKSGHQVIGNSSDRRRDNRFLINLEVILVSKNGKSFRSSTFDLSLGGTLLEKAVPLDFLGHPFDLIIVNKNEPNPRKQRLLFKGKIVGDVSEPRRLSFVDPSPETVAKLNELIAQNNKAA